MILKMRRRTWRSMLRNMSVLSIEPLEWGCLLAPDLILARKGLRSLVPYLSSCLGILRGTGLVHMRVRKC